MKKILGLSIFFLILITFPFYVFAQIDDIQPDEVRLNTITDIESTSQTTTTITGEHIKNFDVNITVNKDATIDVLEKINYDFSTLQKHGIYRQIPTIWKNKEGKKYRLDYSKISVTDENSNSYQFSKIYENDYLKLKIGSANIFVTGIKKYVIRYKVTGALTYFSDHDELYWNVTGNEWTVPIANSIVKIALPETIKKEDIKVVCYTGSSGNTTSNCSMFQEDNKAAVTSKDILYGGQGLTFAISFPIDVVAHLEAKEVVDFWQTFVGKLISMLIGLAVLFWYVIYPIKIIYKWWRYGRDPKGQVQEVRAWFDPPKLKNGRSMTPTEVGSLVDETVDLRDISAGIVDLARQGYFKIEERKKNDFYFIQKKTDQSGLQPFEKKLIDEIFKSKSTVRIKDQELATTVQEASNMVYNQLVTNGLFPKNPNSTRIFYSVIGVLALMMANFPLALIAFTFGRAIPAKTIFGVESANISKSLKNFLTSQERQLAFQAKNQMMFEKLLPYAVAFGVERLWAQRFKDIALKSPEWYSSYDSTRAFNSVLFANSLSSSMSSFRSAATPVSSTTGHSSGFGGGGFSGGGGGGGGGGSW